MWIQLPQVTMLNICRNMTVWLNWMQKDSKGSDRTKIIVINGGKLDHMESFAILQCLGPLDDEVSPRGGKN